MVDPDGADIGRIRGVLAAAKASVRAPMEKPPPCRLINTRPALWAGMPPTGSKTSVYTPSISSGVSLTG